MAQRQLAAPMLIKGETVHRLQRVSFDDSVKSEKWLQGLLFEHPQLIPAHEIEPAFDGLVPLGREVPTNCGPFDLLFANPRGSLALVETKLWRNPSARREVVAQIINYASELSKWSYENLLEAISSCGGRGENNALANLARTSEDFNEAQFIDAVSRNLRLGRFLLLIIGDGIQEGVEHMSEFLQQTPQLGFRIGLVEMALYRVEGQDSETLFVQPRILAKTQEVTRAVVEVRLQEGHPHVKVTLPDSDSVSRSANRLTEEDFLRELSQLKDTDAVELAQWVIANAAAHRLRVHWGKIFLSLFYDDLESGYSFGMGSLKITGELVCYLLRDHCVKLGLPDSIWESYFDAIVSLVPGARRERYRTKKLEGEQVLYGKATTSIRSNQPATEDPSRRVVYNSESLIPLRLLAPRREEWFAAIDRTVERLQKAMRERKE
jgi:hypothetical protein